MIHERRTRERRTGATDAGRLSRSGHPLRRGPAVRPDRAGPRPSGATGRRRGRRRRRAAGRGLRRRVARPGRRRRPAPRVRSRTCSTRIGDEDAIGVVQAITPAERSVLRPAVEGVAGEARRLEVASDELDLDDIAGIELDVEGPRAHRAPTLGDGVAMVDVVGGTLTAASPSRSSRSAPWCARCSIARTPTSTTPATPRDAEGAEARRRRARRRLAGQPALLARRAESGGTWIPSRRSRRSAPASRRVARPAPRRSSTRWSLPPPARRPPAHRADLPRGDGGAARLRAAARRRRRRTPTRRRPVEVSDLRLEVHDGDDGRKVVEATQVRGVGR